MNEAEGGRHEWIARRLQPADASSLGFGCQMLRRSAAGRNTLPNFSIRSHPSWPSRPIRERIGARCFAIEPWPAQSSRPVQSSSSSTATSKSQESPSCFLGDRRGRHGADFVPSLVDLDRAHPAALLSLPATLPSLLIPGPPRRPDGVTKDRAVNKCQVPFPAERPFGCFAEKVPDTYLPPTAKICRIPFIHRRIDSPRSTPWSCRKPSSTPEPPSERGTPLGNEGVSQATQADSLG